MSSSRKDTWASGDSYEPYVGRWSRLVAREFLAWLGMPPNSAWLDVGCGTGALAQVILEVEVAARPSVLIAVRAYPCGHEPEAVPSRHRRL